MRSVLANVLVTSVLALLPAAESLAQTAALSRPTDPRAVAYGKLLNTKVTADFNANPLKDVVEFLSKVADIDIVTYWQTDFKDGLDPESQVTLQLRNPTSLQTVIELVLDQASDQEATWQIGEGFIELGTKDRLNDKRYTMIYPVGDLLFFVPRFTGAPQLDLQSVLSNTGSGGSGGQSIFQDDQQDDQGEDFAAPEEDRAAELIEIITLTIDPYQWADGGGVNEIRYYKGSLIVHAADYLHRQVAGYPFAAEATRPSGRAMTMAPAYVTLSGRYEMSDVVSIGGHTIPVIVGGRVVQPRDD